MPYPLSARTKCGLRQVCSLVFTEISLSEPSLIRQTTLICPLLPYPVIPESFCSPLQDESLDCLCTGLFDVYSNLVNTE